MTGTYRHVKGSKNKSFAVTGGRSVCESDLEIFPAGFQSSVLRFFRRWSGGVDVDLLIAAVESRGLGDRADDELLDVVPWQVVEHQEAAL